MKIIPLTRVILFLLSLTCMIQLSSCAFPQRYLTVDASILKKQMDKREVQKLLDYPDAVTTNENGDEEWFYYNEHSHFWQSIPLIGKYLGQPEVETLMITFRDGKVIKWVYYVEKL